MQGNTDRATIFKKKHIRSYKIGMIDFATPNMNFEADFYVKKIDKNKSEYFLK